jgi:hypothetical protein
VGLSTAALGAIPELRSPGFYFHDDMETQYVPVAARIGHACLAGHIPLLVPESWSGGAIVGEYQHGVFSIVQLLLCAAAALFRSSPAATADWLVLPYFGVMAAGAFCLARARGLARAPSVLVALVTALNGYTVIWSSWLVGLAGFAWIPWTWWALSRLLETRETAASRVAVASLFVYLVFASGWHFAVLMMVALAAVLAFAARTRLGSSVALARVALPMIIGFALAAPATLSFLEYAGASSRSDFDAPSWAWSVPPAAVQGLILPASVSVWSIFGTAALHENIELYAGLVPAILVLTGLLASPDGTLKRHRALLLAIAAVALLAAAPSVSRVRSSFRWLPMFHLLVGLLAAEMLAQWPHPGRGLQRAARSLAVCGAWCIAVVVLLQPLRAPLAGALLVAAALLMGLAVAELAARRRPEGARWGVVGVTAFALCSSPLGRPVRNSTPHWDFSPCTHVESLYRPHDLHLGLYRLTDIMDLHAQAVGGRAACLLPGNEPMLRGLSFVNGYSVLFLEGMRAVLGLGLHGQVRDVGLRHIIEGYILPGGLLDRLGVTALVVPDDTSSDDVRERLSAAGWNDTVSADGVVAMRRREATPALALLRSIPGARRFGRVPEAAAYLETSGTGTALVEVGAPRDGEDVSFGSAAIALGAVSDDAVEADVDVPRGGARALLVLRRPYYPGYRATLEGAALSVSRVDGILVGVAVPTGARGHLRIAYRPWGLRWGPWLSGLGAIAMAVIALLERRRVKIRSTRDRAPRA